MTVLLKQDDLNYLICHILPLLEEQGEVCIRVGSSYGYKLVMTDEVAEHITSACLTRLMQVGLKADHEPNAEGIRVETLADYFNPAD